MGFIELEKTNTNRSGPTRQGMEVIWSSQTNCTTEYLGMLETMFPRLVRGDRRGPPTAAAFAP